MKAAAQGRPGKKEMLTSIFVQTVARHHLQVVLVVVVD